MFSDDHKHSVSVRDLLAALEEIASFRLAAGWDNVGLMTGNPGQPVSGVLVGLDPTENLLDEAENAGLNAIVTHHPLIFHPLKTVRTDLAVGRFLQKALAAEISVIGCHTNLDLAAGGVNDVLAAALGLQDVRPLTVTEDGPLEEDRQEQVAGFGRYGRLPEPMTAPAFLKHLHTSLAQPVLAVAGKLPVEITTVAVCGGSGSDLAETAWQTGAQVYITGEIKHSVARWAEASNFCVIDAGHFATENPVVTKLAGLLTQVFAGKGRQIPIKATTRQKNPFVFHQAGEDHL